MTQKSSVGIRSEEGDDLPLPEAVCMIEASATGTTLSRQSRSLDWDRGRDLGPRAGEGRDHIICRKSCSIDYGASTDQHSAKPWTISRRNNRDMFSKACFTTVELMALTHYRSSSSRVGELLLGGDRGLTPGLAVFSLASTAPLNRKVSLERCMKVQTCSWSPIQGIK